MRLGNFPWEKSAILAMTAPTAIELASVEFLATRFESPVSPPQTWERERIIRSGREASVALATIEALRARA